MTPMLTLHTTVRVTGPLARGEGPHVMRAYLADAMAEIADAGGNMVRRDYDMHHRAPTGHARSRVSAISDPERAVIGDGGIVYGPWLEGVSRRNRTTRFRGYAHYRRTRQRLEREALAIARRVLPRYLRILGGR